MDQNETSHILRIEKPNKETFVGLVEVLNNLNEGNAKRWSKRFENNDDSTIFHMEWKVETGLTEELSARGVDQLLRNSSLFLIAKNLHTRDIIAEELEARSIKILKEGTVDNDNLLDVLEKEFRQSRPKAKLPYLKRWPGSPRH